MVHVIMLTFWNEIGVLSIVVLKRLSQRREGSVEHCPATRAAWTVLNFHCKQTYAELSAGIIGEAQVC